MSEIFDPKPGELLYKQLDQLSKKEKFIIYRLVELGVTIQNPTNENDPTLVIKVPHDLADPLNIEIGFLLNELASGDFANNLLGILSGKDISIDIDINEIREKETVGIRFADSYPSYLKYYVYRHEDEES